jgi:peptidyl-prolyl cis-trans isomerase B (cyclophilin B)
MKRRGCFFAALVCCTLLATAAFAGPRVRLETTSGNIVIELNRDKAPKTVDNFLAYVRSGFYNGTIFHRVIKGFMIQGGGLDEDMREKPNGSPILNEANNGLKNGRYAIAMARTGDPHSATSQFFINVADNPALDFRNVTRGGFGYAVFGRVVGGEDVVDAIAGVPTGRKAGHEDVPLAPVIIKRAVAE